MGDTLLQKTEASGVYYLNPSRRNTVIKAAELTYFCHLTATLTGPSTTHSVLQQLGQALHFPTWYGANFDALYDCLTDPEWQPSRGHVLLIDGIAPLRASEPDDFATFIEVLQNAAEARRNEGNPFWILLDTPARGIPPLPDA